MQVAIAKIRNDNYLKVLDTGPVPFMGNESTYTNLISTVNRRGEKTAYHDIRKHTINLLELPDIRS